ncbi:hypothetical protein BOTBODRAFT_408758 [Botryobasidium botryosum FD-172 SS1]|uniref:Uncharacterized protein n=1 Tax=Botryobasidium botryosum (strain FD-172 SS1) TaxID=930990 RepID=A0A067MDC4_BOTB1|nr:hypothetical protein BOTBODRAFT_408758 [Botryobasidium botryosum FD-172 SS1]
MNGIQSARSSQQYPAPSHSAMSRNRWDGPQNDSRSQPEGTEYRPTAIRAGSDPLKVAGAHTSDPNLRQRQQQQSSLAPPEQLPVTSNPASRRLSVYELCEPTPAISKAGGGSQPNKQVHPSPPLQVSRAEDSTRSSSIPLAPPSRAPLPKPLFFTIEPPAPRMPALISDTPSGSVDPPPTSAPTFDFSDYQLATRVSLRRLGRETQPFKWPESAGVSRRCVNISQAQEIQVCCCGLGCERWRLWERGV